jgi:hypothetical protein
MFGTGGDAQDTAWQISLPLFLARSKNRSGMEDFANLMLRASKALGAPSHLARQLGLQPSEVYRWIAGVDRPARPHLGHFQARLIELLEGTKDARMRGRRWSDRS